MRDVWRVGDRVIVDPTNRGDVVVGTVTAVDEGGVFVDLDHPVRGLSTCYATHDELTREAVR